MEATFNTIPIRKFMLTIYCNAEARVSIAVFISSLQKCVKNIYIAYTMPVKQKCPISLSRHFIFDQNFGTWWRISD